MQSANAEYVGNRAFAYVRSDRAVNERTVEHEEDVNCRQHDEIKDCCTENRDAFLFLCKTERNRECKDERQIAENDAADVGQDQHEAEKSAAGMQHTLQTVRRNCRRVGERSTDAEQNAREREYRDRQEQCFTNLLSNSKCAATSHGQFPLFKIVCIDFTELST